ncbi:MAG: YcxB family protein [Luteolibacter sp.]
MTIRYITTRGDLVSLCFSSMMKSRITQVIYGLISLQIAYSVVTTGTFMNHSFGLKVAVGFATAAFIYAVMFTFAFVLSATIMLMRKNTGILGEHEISIMEEGLLEVTAHNESLNRWSAYHKTISTNRYLRLYVTEGTCHSISKKRPLLVGDINAFEALLREKSNS